MHVCTQHLYSLALPASALRNTDNAVSKPPVTPESTQTLTEPLSSLILYLFTMKTTSASVEDNLATESRFGNYLIIHKPLLSSMVTVRLFGEPILATEDGDTESIVTVSC